MASFLDARTSAPVAHVTVAQGVTLLLSLPRFNANDVAVRTQDFNIAFVDRVRRLDDATKLAYNSHFDIHEVATHTNIVETNGLVFYQLCGNRPGTTALTARLTTTPSQGDYAPPVAITVTENKKLLSFAPPKPFDILWGNHPFNPMNRSLYKDPSHPCERSGWLVGQCMIRFCTALHKSGVGLLGLSGQPCGQPGVDHAHHFIDPYDFEKWKGLGQAYSWEVASPYQAEPMPGIAAYYFVRQRRGVILFRNYFSAGAKKTNMAGGHIDLWNRDRMGNTFTDSDPSRGHSAFVRARKIVFWPLEPV